MFKRLLCLVLLTAAVRGPADTPITPVPSHADFRVAAIQVRIAPDHRDWTYRPGEPARPVELRCFVRGEDGAALTETWSHLWSR